MKYVPLLLLLALLLLTLHDMAEEARRIMEEREMEEIRQWHAEHRQDAGNPGTGSGCGIASAAAPPPARYISKACYPVSSERGVDSQK